MEAARLRALGHPDGLAQGAGRPHDRAHDGAEGLVRRGPFTFRGEHYTITDLDGTPAPHRAGGPPILIGGGAPRVLRFAGATADIVGVNASIHSGEVDAAAAQDALAERIDEKVGWVQGGRRRPLRRASS